MLKSAISQLEMALFDRRLVTFYIVTSTVCFPAE